jgi:hypothetical protein
MTRRNREIYNFCKVQPFPKVIMAMIAFLIKWVMSQNRRTQAVVAILQKSDTFLFVKRSDYNDTASGY